MHEFSINEIVQDLKAVLDCLQTCVFNTLKPAIYQAVIPYLCSFVYSGFEYLNEHNIILGTTDKSFKKRLDKSRSKFLKQYTEFNRGTFNKLKKFNEEEFNRFFSKEYPDLSLIKLKHINNYYLASINDKPIDNYHLCSSILGCEIGSYIDDITPQVQSFIYQMTKFIVQVLVAAHIKPVNSTKKISFAEIKYEDINMTCNHPKFCIKDNPTILMAMLDILCTINSYNEIFTKINTAERLDLKIKYLILFSSVVGLKKVISFCRESNIELIIDGKFEEFVTEINEKYCTSQMRNYCAHYGYKETDWKNDPVVECFEKNINKPINEISVDLSKHLLTLGNYLNKFLIKVPVS